MASDNRKLIRIKTRANHHRWHPGTTLRISDQQIRRDGLKPDDYDVLDDPAAGGGKAGAGGAASNSAKQE